jgi:hypothetical protein
MELTGRLGAVSLAELLQWPARDRRTGALVVRTARREKRVIFSHGEIVGCQSGDPSESLGQHLLLNGYVSRERLLDALSLCRSTGVRLGTALVDLGVLSPEAALAALRAHVEERVCDLFLWEHGVFYFEQDLPDPSLLLSVPLDPVSVALEGSRWSDEEARIREVLVHDGVVLRRARKPEATPATPLERQVYATLERPHRLDELYAQVHGSPFRFLEATYGMLVHGLIDIDRLDAAGDRSSEIRMFDLLLEQAASEEVLFSARHLSLPLEWLSRFFPLWVESEEEDAEPIGAEEAAFYRRMDGSRSLGDLVLDDPSRRQERMDLVLLELQKGRLALLPRPLPEIKALGSGVKNPWLRRFMG